MLVFEHIGITVSDLERSIAFYTRVFGFQVLRKSATIAYLHLGDDLIELMQGRAASAAPRPGTPGAWREHLWSAGGIIHLAFRVDDLDGAIQEITELGGELVVPPYKSEPEVVYAAETSDDKLRRVIRPVGKSYWRAAIFADPDGVMLQLLER
jgi:glyoxylase I family protein